MAGFQPVSSGSRGIVLTAMEGAFQAVCTFSASTTEWQLTSESY